VERLAGVLSVSACRLSDKSRRFYFLRVRAVSNCSINFFCRPANCDFLLHIPSTKLKYFQAIIREARPIDYPVIYLPVIEARIRKVWITNLVLRKYPWKSLRNRPTRIIPKAKRKLARKIWLSTKKNDHQHSWHKIFECWLFNINTFYRCCSVRYLKAILALAGSYSRVLDQISPVWFPYCDLVKARCIATWLLK